MVDITKRVLLLVSVSLFTIACSDKVERTLEEVCDGLRGKYECESIIWKGSPSEIDIDGDGVCSNDIKSQMLSFINCELATQRMAVVYPCTKYGPAEGNITFCFPIQNITYNKISQTCSIDSNGSGCWLNLHYGVKENGNIVLSEHNELTENRFRDATFYMYCYDLKDKLDARIVSLGDGSLIIEMENTYLNFATADIVRGTVEYLYRRVSYAIK